MKKHKNIKIFVEQKKKRWAEISANWLRLSPPAYPSREDMEKFEAIVKIDMDKRKNPQIVILGSTPELRNLFCKYSSLINAEIFCLDITEEMYMAMSNLVNCKNAKEKFIKGNWLRINTYFKPKSIDLVIGDHVISNVGGFEDLFFSNIKKILKTDGVFLTRAHFTDQDVPKVISVKDLLRKYAKLVKEKKITLQQGYNYFGMALLFASWHKNKDNKISLTYYNDQINKLEDKKNSFSDKIEKEIFDRFLKVWSGMRKNEWTNLPKGKLFAAIEKHFEIKDYLYSAGHEQWRQSIIFRLVK